MNLRTLEQERAKFAYEKVREVMNADENVQKKYSSYVKSAPALIMTSGLGQTLAFYLSKLEKKGEADCESIIPIKEEKAEKIAYAYLYKHICEWLAERRKLTDNRDPLKFYLEADALEAITLTQETLALLNWLKKFADAMLEKEKDQER
ncbi:CRISPR-associated RAMP Cmr5 [Thermococcus sp. 2319x1]|uniref:type III-B CRISPR module-associated protein Cmr5 n=1 Tax=Thermococcus sp. 2319x1 TaxID=1674923 RepID=UPI00073ADC25|nr:type III-B CRISPR module-associated protein Cmr5 [Thermococcus sp. 2319x1]ALV63532.1 CRISPR-associated RAMP Cmr5 [Thermococcus sp. 2319x1]